MTGTVIDSGDGNTHVFPVCDGFVIGSCVKSIPLAGSDMTEYIMKEIIARNEHATLGAKGGLPELARVIKEKECYVAKDLLKEFEKFDEKQPDANGNLTVQSSRFKKFTHTTVNGVKQHCDIGYERFLAPEMFFHPEFMKEGWNQPLDAAVDECIW